MEIKEILRLSESDLKKALYDELKAIGCKKVVSGKGYLYSPGMYPVLLVAHLDTVHNEPVRDICISEDRNILMSPQGIGGDDRAGVYTILEILKKVSCHVLFCEQEEIGGIGALCFSKNKIKPKVNYIIEFDRRGNNDAVFYSCENKDFENFICGFGFKKAGGSFSDISILAPALGIAAVNLSSGYYNEHMPHEHINMKDVRRNIKRGIDIIKTETGFFEYVEKKYNESPFYELLGNNMFDYEKYYFNDSYYDGLFDDEDEE